MNQQLDTQLKAIFDQILTVTPAPGPAPLGEPLQLAQPGPNRRPWLAVAAATIVFAGIGSLIALTARGENVEPAISSPDVTEPPPTAVPAPTAPLTSDTADLDTLTVSSSVLNADTTCTLSGLCTEYIVLMGVNPAGVAQQYCVSVAELAAANDWPDLTGSALPSNTFLIPSNTPSTCPEPDSP